MALADQILEATPKPLALLLSNEARDPPALTGTKIVTVDANGSSDGTVTLVSWVRGLREDAKRRPHPLRYERQFSPKASPVTEGLKLGVLSEAPD